MRNFYVKEMQSLQLYLSTEEKSEQPQNLAAVGKKSRTSSISGEILHRLVVPPCQQNCPTFMSKKCNPCNYIYWQTSNLSSHKIVWLCPPASKTVQLLCQRNANIGGQHLFIVWELTRVQISKTGWEKDLKGKTRRFSSEIESGREYSWENAKVYLCANTGAAPQIQDAG